MCSLPADWKAPAPCVSPAWALVLTLALTLTWAICLCSPGAAQAAAPSLKAAFIVEEFNGALPGWANARDFGAVGDGVADDSDALQAAIDSLGRKRVFGSQSGWHPEFYVDGSASTLYLPAGTYRITRTLQIHHRRGVHLVGEDPATTRIQWAGPAGGTMLITDGNLTGKFQRLTWDGRGSASIGVAHWFNSYKLGLGDVHGGSSQHIDEVFVDLGIGIFAGCCAGGSQVLVNETNHPGTRLDAQDDLRVNHRDEYIASPLNYWAYEDYGELDSEGGVQRVHFIRNSRAGIQVGSFNALNWWVLDSVFEDCAQGVSNTPGAGNFLLYRNTFLRSRTADAHIGNTGFFSMRDNVSSGSAQLFRSDEVGANGGAVTLQRNRVLAATSDTLVYNGSLGPLMLLDNEFDSRAGSTGPVVSQQDWEPGRLIFSIGNAFTVEPAQQISMRYDTYDPNYNPPSQKRQIADRVLPSGSISSALPPAVPTPPLVTRPIFAVPVRVSEFFFELDGVGEWIRTPVSTGADIQAAIDAAVASGAPQAVVYLPPAAYTVSQTLRVPRLTRLQIVGDGMNSVLVPGAALPAGAAFIELEGPSLATVKDLALQSNAHVGVSLDHADQDGGLVFVNGLFGGSLSTQGLLRTRLSALANTGFSVLEAVNTASLAAVGQNLGLLRVRGNSRVAVVDTWKESSGVPVFDGLDGTVTFQSGLVAPQVGNHQPPNSNDPSLLLDGYSGRLSYLSMSFAMSNAQSNNGILIGREIPTSPGQPGTNVLALGVSANAADYFVRSGDGGQVGFAMMRQVQPANRNANTVLAQGQADDASVTAGLAQLRAIEFDRVAPSVPAGATDVRLLRVYAPDTSRSIVVQGNLADCLDAAGEIQPEGATSQVDSAQTVAGTRAATPTECPYGGSVPTLTVQRQIYACSAGVIATRGQPVAVVSDAGAPQCNQPIACADPGGTLHPDGSSYDWLGDVVSQSTRAASATECPLGGTVSSETHMRQTYACHQGVGSPQGASVPVTTERLSCNAPGSGEGQVPLPGWALAALGLLLAASGRQAAQGKKRPSA